MKGKGLSKVVVAGILVWTVVGVGVAPAACGKVDLINREGGAVVGHTSVCSFPGRFLIITACVKSGAPRTNFDVWIKVNGQNLTWPGEPSGHLWTGWRGKGWGVLFVVLECEYASPAAVTVVVKKPADKFTGAKGYVGTVPGVILFP